MERSRDSPHNGAMRLTRTHTTLAAAVTMLLLVVGLVGPANAQTDTTDSADVGAGDVVILGLEFEAENHLERLLGGSVRGTATAIITNTGTAPTTVEARVLADDGIFLMPELTLAPGETAAVATEINLGPLNLRERDILAVAGDSAAVASHRSMPWLLIGLIALSANVVLLAGRDKLRQAVRRQMAAAARA